MTPIAVPASPPISLPNRIEVAPGRLVEIPADASGAVEWAYVSDAIVDFKPLGPSAWLVAPEPCCITVLAYTAAGDKPSPAAICKVTVRVGAPPSPPVPPIVPTPPAVPWTWPSWLTPGSLPTWTRYALVILVSLGIGVATQRFGCIPGPAPIPVPPIPVPVPVPSDPFFLTLAEVYAKDPDKTKAQNVAQLANFYRAAAVTTINDPTLKTTGDFFAKFKSAVDTVLPAGSLSLVRPALGAELSKVLPTSASAPLDDATRKNIASHYNRIATDLEGLK